MPLDYSPPRYARGIFSIGSPAQSARKECQLLRGGGESARKDQGEA